MFLLNHSFDSPEKDSLFTPTEFIDTGIAFYDKLLKKNVALRNLSGENIYTASGNENYMLRQKSLPLTIRKAFFEMKKKELEEAAKGTTPDKSAS